MTGLDDLYAFISYFYILMTDRQTDRLTLVLVKSLLRLKIGWLEGVCKRISVSLKSYITYIIPFLSSNHETGHPFSNIVLY